MRMIMVNGAQRSGTTMLGSLLGSAEGAVVLPDSGLLRRATSSVAPATVLSATEFRTILASIDRLSRWPFELHDLLNPTLPKSSTLSGHVFAFARHVAEMQDLPEPWIVVSHEPTDVYGMTAIDGHFDDLALVNVIRDGRAVAASMQRVSWGPPSLVVAARAWERQVCYGLASAKYLRFHSRLVSECRFEDLVSDAQGQTERIARELELVAREEMWTEGAFAPLEFSRADHQLVGKAPDPLRADDWRRELSRAGIALVESQIGGLLQLLGYSDVACEAVPRVARLRDGYERSLGVFGRRIHHGYKMRQYS